MLVNNISDKGRRERKVLLHPNLPIFHLYLQDRVLNFSKRFAIPSHTNLPTIRSASNMVLIISQSNCIKVDIIHSTLMIQRAEKSGMSFNKNINSRSIHP